MGVLAPRDGVIVAFVDDRMAQFVVGASQIGRMFCSCLLVQYFKNLCAPVAEKRSGLDRVVNLR